MNLNKIYTRAGDKGETSLIGGERISKASLRLECYGTLDELNAFAGRLKVAIVSSQTPKYNAEEINEIQKKLFDAGAILATPSGKKWEQMPSITEKDVEYLEKAIDKMNANLKPLKEFTVPGENAVNAEAHICRTVARRAERALWRAKEQGEIIDGLVFAYINRLSDYFFVLSRI